MAPPRRTRIVATVGPALDPPAVLRAALAAGIDVVRVNFSHGTADEHLGRVAAVRAAAAELGRTVAVLGDLPGPKMRVRLAGPRELAVGSEVAFSAAAKAGPDELAITEPEALHDAQAGQRILLDDGRLQLRVLAAGQSVRAVVVVGGTLLPGKGVNLPDTALPMPSLTDGDRDALAVAARAGVDWLAMSFVRTARAADDLRAAARAVGLDVPVMAKVERPEGVDHAGAIIAAFDGVMVARGDLGVEIPLERVPTVQKRLIALARAAGKPVVTATDMLDSMRANPRPTRAEAGDVANAVYDGTDAVMLSGETAVGNYPVEAVACMHTIALEAESHMAELGHPAAELRLADSSVDDHVTQAVIDLAGDVQADAIITPTQSGRTARLLARHRPRMAIVAPTPSERVLRQMAVVWGLRPVPMAPGRRPGDDRLTAAVQAAFAAGAVKAGDRVVVLAGHPVEGGKNLPTIRLTRVGDGGAAEEP